MIPQTFSSYFCKWALIIGICPSTVPVQLLSLIQTPTNLLSWSQLPVHFKPEVSLQLRGRVHQFFSHMHEFFPHKLTGLFLSTLDYGFIMSRRIFQSTLCFIGYTTILLWILEKVLYFLRLYHATFTGCCLRSGTTILPLYNRPRNDVSISPSDVLLPPSACFTLEQR